MLTQNTVKRLLEGSAEALDEDVAPFVQDHFASMQVRAIRELLLNLADRVTWQPEELEAEERDLREIVAAVRPDSPSLPDGRTDGDAVSRVDALRGAAEAAIGELGTSPATVPDEDARREEVERILRRQTTANARALTSTMYRAPSATSKEDTR